MRIKSLIGISRLALIAAFDGPKLLTEADGSTVKLRNGKLVFIGDDNKEEEVSPDEIYSGRSRLAAVNSEAANHRREAQTAKDALKQFTDAGITDAKKAADAIALVEKLDQKKLIDAGEVDKVRESIKQTYEGQTATERQRADAAEARVKTMILNSTFERSPYVKDNIAIPVDIFQSTFGKYFEVDNDGKITAKDASGNPILTRDPNALGNPAPFEEAVKSLVEGYGQKDAILRGNDNKGSGNGGGGGSTPRGRVMRRAEFDQLDAAAKHKIATEQTIKVVD
jgi:hypothetical protein